MQRENRECRPTTIVSHTRNMPSASARKSGRCIWTLVGLIFLGFLLIMFKEPSCRPQFLQSEEARKKDAEWNALWKGMEERERRESEAQLAEFRAKGTILLSPGDTALIVQKGGAFFARSHDDLIRLGDLIGAGDDFGVEQMARENRASVLEEGTMVLVIGPGPRTVLGVPLTYEVRVKSGELENVLGYIITDAAKTMRR